MRLFVGGYGTYVSGRRFLLDGDREYSAAHRAKCDVPDAWRVSALLDSGAFTDGPDARLTPPAALARQLTWEQDAARKWDAPGWQARYLVSYDRLIDETWTAAGARQKRRWTVDAAERAVAETVDAAAYLASQRSALAPRTLILSCQGVDALQYEACTRAVLDYATPDDWLGLGGWCILGRQTSWLPTFWATLYRVLPQIAAARVRHVHIFGVLYRPALGGLLWLTDRHNMTLSTDSSAPVLSAAYTTSAARKKAGVLAPDGDWETNVAMWQQRLADLRHDTRYYRQPPRVDAARQLTLIA